MPELSVLIKPASSLCNLRCKYCFYADVSDIRQIKSYGLMSHETVDHLLAHTLAYADHITYAFQGGEPTLAGLPFFEYFVLQVAEQTQKLGRSFDIRYSIQTNGTMLDEAWCTFLKQHHFLVGLSLDGNAAFHDRNRVDAANAGTYAQVHHAKLLLEQYGVEYNILWVLTNYTARFPRKVWKFLCEEDISYVQFIPCLGPLDGSDSPYRLTPQRFCRFYSELYVLWDQALRQGHYRSVKFFDDVFQLILNHRVTACGFTGRCSMQFIVEGDGSVYPCDFYVLDPWCCGNFNEDSVEDILQSPAVKAFLTRDHQVPEPCMHCKWWKICGSGCMRMRESMYLERDSSYCGYGSFLTENQQRLAQTASLLGRK